MRLVDMHRYRLTIPGVDPVVVTYTGKYGNSGFECDVCRHEGRGGHEFLEGDPENHTWAWHVGTECIKKCKVEAISDEARVETMRQLFEVIEESFPSAGRGMQWGEGVSVALEDFEAYLKRVVDGEGIFVVSTMTRVTPIRAKDIKAWEAHGKPVIKLSSDGKNFAMQERGSYVKVAPHLLQFLPLEKAE